MSVTFLIFIIGWLVFAAATVASIWAGYLLTQEQWLDDHGEQYEIKENRNVVHTGVDDPPA
jgi:sensor domain CHASE-containing protein